MVRRQADRDLLMKLQKAQGGQSQDKEARRMHRRAIRHNCEVRVALQLSHAAGSADVWQATEHPIKGRILDLSTEGCQLFFSQPIEIGQKLSLAIALRTGKKVQTPATVRWTKAVPQKNGYACGVQFTQLGPKDEKSIVAFLNELDATIGL